MSPIETINRIAEVAEIFAAQAGVGAMETAGGLVSYVAAHPEHLDLVLEGRLLDLPMDWFECGRLTWQATNGKVVHPSDVRFARIVKQLESGGQKC